MKPAPPPLRRTRRSIREKEFFYSVIFFGSVTALVLGFLAYLWIYNEVNLQVKEIAELEEIRENVRTENGQLEGEIASLSRADRITEIARTQLQMVSPEPESLAVFVDAALLTLPGDAR